MRDDAIHDQHASGDQAGADIDQQRLAAPDQIDQVTERHFQRPRNTRPEGQAGEKGGGKIEVILDEKGTDDRGQARDARGQVNH